jgi:hypothetical protein
VVVADTPGRHLTASIREHAPHVRIVAVCGNCPLANGCGADICLSGQFSARELTAAVAG